MRNSKLLFFIISFTFIGSLCSQSIQTPSLSYKKTTKTLIIDSIPVTTPINYRLTGISKNDYNYRQFLGTIIVSDYPSFGISRVCPFLVVRNNAFTHKSLFDPLVNNSLQQQQSWDNPYGTDSFGVGVIAGSIQFLSSIFKK
ncbi:hypothetical protein D1818_18070 [Aquimarina sp. BL5]|uniref:hypothetical protein n=1 Tax=Aquimarina sp. BL5 TaxID=1714860 RepID=UPI000E52A0F7|nr:hypothetical protein [Aquimarina sp. BL5]AXT52647.1 hypothetical protein D1818_18070 [Aquimarina sp. BL5]RKN11711.1 hypothetical protein D7036_00770 [Aquimarina sp. BL5]